jgi:hypothetical protein
LSSLLSIFAVGRADFLERIRSYSFFLTLLFAVLLGYGAATGKVAIHLGDFRGVYTSAWIGTMVAMVATCFLSLVGFYIVKNAIDRDRRTGVGQILAATPLSKLAYMFGKFLSNFAVLATMVLILAVGALAMQFLVAEDKHYDFVALLLPFVFLALPTMALTAAVAVLFETLPVLRGGVGNVVWFFAFCFGLGLPEITGKRWMDLTGLMTVGESMMAAARAAVPGYKNDFSLTISPGQVQIAERLRWPGVDWNLDTVALRGAWLLVAFAIVALAALIFDRFDATRFAMGRKPKTGSALPGQTGEVLSSSARPAGTVHLTPVPPSARSGGFAQLCAAELRLALAGVRWWWFVVALGLLVAESLAPLDAARGPLLAVAWLWPVLIWSAMGTREERFGTRALLFSSPGILTRQLPACFVAGISIAMIAGGGVAARLLLTGQASAFLGWLAGAIFLPSMALGLGVVSGSGKAFEAILTVLWYIGPMNHVPGLDFTGTSSGPLAMRYAVIYGLLSAALLAISFLGRAKQLRSS